MNIENTNQPPTPIQNSSQIQSLPSEDQPRQSKKLIILLGIIIALFAFGVGGYFLGANKNQTTPQSRQVTVSPTISQPSPTNTPISVEDSATSTWKTYTSQEGNYSFKYPANVKVYVNEKFSVDGVKIPLKDTVVLLSEVLPGLNTNYQMSINHKLTNSSSLNDFVDKNSSCTSIESIKGKVYNLGGKQSLIFEDTPCGPYGMSSIYSLNRGLGYIIEIETRAGYSDIKKYTDEILSTFKFTN